MSYSAEPHRAAGTLITAGIWNQAVSDNPAAIYAGAMSITSQAVNDVLFATSTTQLGRLAVGTAYQRLRVNAGASALEWASGGMHLLKANSGTDTSAGATTVDTIVLPTLTAKDSIITMVTLNAVTQATARPHLYHVTDGALLLDFLNSLNLVFAAGNPGIYGQCITRQRQSGNTALESIFLGYDPNLNKVGSGDQMNRYTATATWGSGWTLGLRHNGVTAGGTLQWSWAIYLLPGQ